jgi:hypothetical protein
VCAAEPCCARLVEGGVYVVVIPVSFGESELLGALHDYLGSLRLGLQQCHRFGDVLVQRHRVGVESALALQRGDPVTLVLDQRSAAGPIRPLLEQANIEATLTNASQLAVACGRILDDALAAQLSHTGQQVLSDAIASATKQDLAGGGFAWDRQAGGSITPLMAATLAHWALLGSSPPKPPPPPPLMERITTRDDDEFDRVLAPNVDNFLTTPF